MNRIALYSFLLCLISIFIIKSFSFSTSLESDWLQYRADAGRTGYTATELSHGLSLNWVFEQKPPSPAWKGVGTRMTFDYAYQPVIGGQKLFFGSSTDCKVYALDIETGNIKWEFFTDSPVRFAPALWKDRIYVVSDDGYLYCLSAENGSELWKKRGGQDDAMILGNDRMVSRWPARGGVVIKDDIVYFGAGIWPSEGIYIYALDPHTGKELWVNDNSGGLEWDQPHGGARAKSALSSQGYLVAAGNHLFVPSGRSVPGALQLETGKLDYLHLQIQRAYGGSRVLADDSFLFLTSGNTNDGKEIIGTRFAVFNNADGMLVTNDEFNSQAIAISPDYIYCVNSQTGELQAFSRSELITEKEVTDWKGASVKQNYLSTPVWTVKTNQPESISLIAAGRKVISGSVNNKVTVLDINSKSIVWTSEVDGIPYGLAVANGKLYVSTDKGSIYCFDSIRNERVNIVKSETVNYPYGNNETYETAADEIIRLSGITDGYCLDLGCGDGRLAFELARKTNFRIYAVDPDIENVINARRRLDAAGLYGSRVTVHHGDISGTGYPKYFANLVVSGNSVNGEIDAAAIDEISRLQRPFGGVACVGKPGAMKKTVRGPLDGAGNWTHQYQNPANTITSDDELVRGPLGMLWFRDSDFEMPSRHGRGVAPLFSEGRLFIQGNHGIRAVDAYNGHTLWEYYIEDLMKPYDQDHLAGTAVTHGNWCIEGDKLYVRTGASTTNHTGRTCLVLDAASGVKLAEYRVPPRPDGKQYGTWASGVNDKGYWGYIAVEDGTIYGTIVNDSHIPKWGYRESDMFKLFSESIAVFAMDAETGKVKWIHSAEHSIRHNAIAISNGYVYLIDRPVAEFDHVRNPHQKGIHPGGKLVVLDSETGKIKYTKKDNIFGTLLALSTEHDILVMTYQFTRFRLPSENDDRMSAFRASTGELLWDIKTGTGEVLTQYGSRARPIINGNVIYVEPFAFDIHTGEKLDFTMNRSYGCGIMSSSKNLLLFRSATLGYIDLLNSDIETQNFGGIRPGCWINVLPVGGIVLMPDATERCNCSYLIKANIALQCLE